MCPTAQSNYNLTLIYGCHLSTAVLDKMAAICLIQCKLQVLMLGCLEGCSLHFLWWYTFSWSKAVGFDHMAQCSHITFSYSSMVHGHILPWSKTVGFDHMAQCSHITFSCSASGGQCRRRAVQKSDRPAGSRYKVASAATVAGEKAALSHSVGKLTTWAD